MTSCASWRAGSSGTGANAAGQTGMSGGPGMGGCPAGPRATAASRRPCSATVRVIGRRQIEGEERLDPADCGAGRIFAEVSAEQ